MLVKWNKVKGHIIFLFSLLVSLSSLCLSVIFFYADMWGMGIGLTILFILSFLFSLELKYEAKN